MLRLSLICVLLAGSGPAQDLIRGPSVWSTTEGSFLLAFKSSVPVAGAVEWGTTKALGRLATGPSTDDHAITIGGLDPDRFYYYRVRLGVKPVTPVYRTRTFGDKQSSDLTFFVMGDTGTGGKNQLRIGELLERYSFDLGLLAGDVIYDRGEPENFDPRFFQPYARLLRHFPFYTVTGDHDILTQNGKPYYDAMHLPTSSSGTERWYSFDAGGVHFIGLESKAPKLAAQIAWLRKDLADARKRGAQWIFVFFHHPPFNSGIHGRDEVVYQTWCPIFEEFEVDAVFSAHDHHYERTNVIRKFHRDKRGVVYFVVGTGGQYLYKLGTLKSYSAFGVSSYGALKVDIRGKVMHTEFLDGTLKTLGQIIDPYVISRGDVTTALRATSGHPEVGKTFYGMFDAPRGAKWVLYLAVQPSYFPLPPHGIFQLSPTQNALLALGTMGGRRYKAFRLKVPRDNAFKGIDLFFQGASLLGTSNLALTDLLVSSVR